ncbi:molybdate ABC transporter permease subunit [Paenibacillus sp. J5C_2022]|uniref:molybdate ABC transporter permease subunit n=1 Tax=Paenibacillus sp. J5C2022 TaxID=2977129 RepID=UPI0021D240BF|nr:molybdate ABC transporter permease subunit [Paenibacillus sp. J5C2022]MCU6709570.1 molybdate ABC transporter permease subunit [Paenibacillus sp. J5C2022]
MMGAEAFWPPILLSLKIAGMASVLVLLIGGGGAWWVSRAKVGGNIKLVLETLFLLPLVLPPTVVGFVLLVVLGRNSPLGQLLESWLDKPIVFTPAAAVIAAVVVAFPLVYQTMKTGYEGVDSQLAEAARSSGANEWQVLRHITLPLCYRSIMTAYILGFARALGEFGATLMIAGNIPGRTQTTPTAIYVAVESGNWMAAWAWTIAIIAISFLLLLLTGWRARGVEQRQR